MSKRSLEAIGKDAGKFFDLVMPNSTPARLIGAYRAYDPTDRDTDPKTEANYFDDTIESFFDSFGLALTSS